MENFYVFVVMCILLILLPGPDFALVTKNTLSFGKGGALKTVLGTCSALLIHTSLAVLGLSALIVKSALLFSFLKYIGAFYLIYIGIKTLWSLRNKETTAMDVHKEKTSRHESFFKQGFYTNIFNPKVALFFLTFFPQFVNTESTFIPFLIMGVTYAILTAIWFTLYIYLIDRIRAFMQNVKTQKTIEGITGVIIIGFGLKLAFEKAH